MIDVPAAPSRGPVSLARTWVSVVVAPRNFFAERVRPGEQAAGLLFAMAVVAVEETTRVALVPDATAVFEGAPLLGAAVTVGLAVVLVTPTALHLVAALQTILLVPFVSDRGDVSETVQLYSYATAPCLLAGVPIPEVRVVCTAWGVLLVTIATSEVHGPWFEPAFFLSAVPSAIVFGYGFRGFDALATLLARWYII